ncbi:MAG TPA: hypothetical protein VGJ77_02810 [Gaiellaceae bacterium]|jgi:hypothetical protein
MRTTRFRTIAVLAAALAAILAYSPLARAADPISVDEAYHQIKDAERGMPVPTPVQTINVGTFDATSGAYDGLATEVEIFNTKPVRIVPEVFVNAVNAKLVFGILRSTQSVRVSVTGVGSASVPAGRTSISINVGRLRTVKWTISSGTVVHRDEFTIKRPKVIGAGAFTIPALPVAVVYDPPQDPARSNSVVYTRTTTVATTLGFSVRSSTSSTATAVNPTFSALGIFQQALQGSATFANATGNGAVGAALTKISGALGSAKRNVTTAEDNASTLRRTFAFSEAHGCSLQPGDPHFGPGHSDLIVYLRNVRVIWLDDGTSTALHVLGTGPQDCTTIDQLRSGVADLDPAAAAALIALDPFAGLLGPKAALAADPRYLALTGIGLLPGILNTATYTQQLLLENGHVETSSRIVSDDLGAGLLSLIGLAPSETQQVSSTLSVSNSVDTSEATTVSTALTARTLTEGVRTELAVFYDRAFGTVAFQDPTP